MKNIQKLDRMTDPIKGSIHFELQKLYQKNYIFIISKYQGFSKVLSTIIIVI